MHQKYPTIKFGIGYFKVYSNILAPTFVEDRGSAFNKHKPAKIGQMDNPARASSYARYAVERFFRDIARDLDTPLRVYRDNQQTIRFVVGDGDWSRRFKG